MGKIRDWMHGSGRKTVIAVVIVIAAAIVIHYFVVERHGKWGLESAYSAGVNETVSPKPQKDYYVGGSRYQAELTKIRKYLRVIP